MPELPDRAELGQLRRQAKDLLRAAESGDPDAVVRLSRLAPQRTLAVAQLAVARQYGFSSWASLKRSVEARGGGVAPLRAGKHHDRAVYTSADFIDGARSRGWDPGPLPAGMIFTSAAHLTSQLEADQTHFRRSSTLTPPNGQVFVTCGEPTVAVACLGAGASGPVTEIEHLVALGVKTFIAVGAAPAVSADLRRGDCVVIDRALRDDGVSQHYAAPARYAYSDPELTDALERAATTRSLAPIRGATWTVPTPYRTTAAELDAYRSEGVLTTELTTAATFAVAAALGASAASAVIVTHNLPASLTRLGTEWHPGATYQLLGAAIETIQANVGRATPGTTESSTATTRKATP